MTIISLLSAGDDSAFNRFFCDGMKVYMLYYLIFNEHVQIYIASYIFLCYIFK